MVQDFFQRVDIAEFHEWTRVDFGGWLLPLQRIVNASGLNVEFSWDGVTQHGEMMNTFTSALEWTDHPRAAVWLRHNHGIVAAPEYVLVSAHNRTP